MSGNHCKHWDGREIMAGNGKCRVGIDPAFSFCDGNSFAMIKKVPCLKTNTDAPKCHLCVFPTKEEVEAQEAAFRLYMDDFMEHMPKARALITKTADETGEHSGAIDCPKCSIGKLHWSRSTYNGHVHAKCESDGCLGWME